MKKIIAFLLLLTGLPCFSAAVGGNGTAPKGAVGSTLFMPTRQTYQHRMQERNSILNVQSGIKNNQNSLRKQFFDPKEAPMNHNNDKGKYPNVKPDGVIPPPPPPRPGVNPNTFVPHVYGWGYYGSGRTEENIEINNTYNYYEAPKTDTKDEVKKEDTKKELTQSQKDEIERQTLRKKYSSILSNKTMSNEKMCKKMEECFKDANYDELDRVLNQILRLNCDIDKLRPKN